jgi:SAM-dependent methyltransferase
MLDMSCGEGQLLGLAARRGLRTFGLDLSLKALHLAKNQAPASFYALGDGEKLPYRDDVFDWVFNLGSLEHYIHPEQGVKELARVLKPDGSALILLPNSFGLLWNVFHVWRTGDIFDDGQPIQRYGTRREWETLLEENGLIVCRTLGYNGRTFPRTWEDFKWYLKRPRKILTSLLFLPFIPLNGDSMFIFFCRKKEATSE